MKHKKLIIILIITAIIAGVIYMGFKNDLIVSSYTLQDEILPKSFDGYVIVQISDLHLNNFGERQDELISAIASCNPDLIVFTGDMIDGYHDNLDNIRYLLDGIIGLAPIYAVSGNHENDNLTMLSELIEMYNEYGVNNIDDETIYLSNDTDNIRLTGVLTSSYLESLSACYDNVFSLMLCHDSLFFEQTSKFHYNLVLSGHLHGGVVRLPLLGGLISTNGSLFPKYCSGMYELNDSVLISSTGLGKTIIPRFNNPYEVVKITLKCQ